MENLGALAVLLAFCFSVFAIAASVIGGWKRRPFLIAAAERAVYSILLLTTVASFVLVSALLAGDFRFSYVAAHSNLAMPVLY
ncbi:MAG TPA: heme lyase CcmF/NrfE family subunit, partial [Bryobacteraceae bacterium]|nr:heme lyase CcmF/NrfE family subunit [Bryobacteraceae bacterium]